MFHPLGKQKVAAVSCALRISDFSASFACPARNRNRNRNRLCLVPVVEPVIGTRDSLDTPPASRDRKRKRKRRRLRLRLRLRKREQGRVSGFPQSFESSLKPRSGRSPAAGDQSCVNRESPAILILPRLLRSRVSCCQHQAVEPERENGHEQPFARSGWRTRLSQAWCSRS